MNKSEFNRRRFLNVMHLCGGGSQALITTADNNRVSSSAICNWITTNLCSLFKPTSWFCSQVTDSWQLIITSFTHGWIIIKRSKLAYYCILAVIIVPPRLFLLRTKNADLHIKSASNCGTDNVYKLHKHYTVVKGDPLILFY